MDIGDIAKGVRKACPLCDHPGLAYEAQTLPSGDTLYRFSCTMCGWPYQKRVRPPKVTVEPLIGFSRNPYRWEPHP